ncbi:hypothetical protein NLI92_002863 [Priestia megaterium]|uniref:hypothetical protein n=1 Tax=Priestia megaterium TaxID=1404 RepID=UPI0021AC21BC|nr:hypothetical protein [Priestia megaterium]MCR8927474.1 hypothetical protein [Priestia megaterium]
MNYYINVPFICTYQLPNHLYRNFDSVNTYYACSPYSDYYFYNCPAYGETAYHMDEEIPRKQKVIPFQQFMIPSNVPESSPPLTTGSVGNEMGSSPNQSIPFTYPISDSFYLKGVVYHDGVEVDVYGSHIRLSREIIKLDGSPVKISVNDKNSEYNMDAELWVVGKALHMSFKIYTSDLTLANSKDVVVFTW